MLVASRDIGQPHASLPLVGGGRGQLELRHARQLAARNDAGRRDRFDGGSQLGVIGDEGHGEVKIGVWRGRKVHLDTSAASLGNVKDQARRAGARGYGCLEVVDVDVEDRRVERGAVVREARLGAHFVVPCFLVQPAVAAAEGLEVLRCAQRHIERIVDSTQAKALGDLAVDVDLIGRSVAEDHPRSHAVGRSCARLRNQRNAVIVVSEDAVEDLLLVLIEVVVAQAAGQTQPVGQRYSHLPEQRELIEVIRQPGKEQVVRWGQQPLSRDSR